MPDEVTVGEVHRSLRDHEARSAEQHRSLDERITALAAQSVPLSVWQQAERARDAELQRSEHERAAEAQRLEREHQADVARLDRAREQGQAQFQESVIKPLVERVDKVEDRPAMTLARWLGVIVAVCAALTLLVEAWGTAKGVK